MANKITQVRAALPLGSAWLLTARPSRCPAPAFFVNHFSAQDVDQPALFEVLHSVIDRIRPREDQLPRSFDVFMVRANNSLRSDFGD
jgi:hypothetical protein